MELIASGECESECPIVFPHGISGIAVGNEDGKEKRE
jgi:hypothetical protein